MEIDELRTKSEAELHDLLKEKRSELRDLEFKDSEGALKEVHKISETKQTIARILTLINQSS